MESFLSIHEEVKDALLSGGAVVALESTIIAHGMPFPQNVETARELEKIIRDLGAVPATIACINGQLCVGLNEDQMECLATSKEVMKCSRRDLPFVLSQKKIGATTVAATMIGAELAGIRIFATGGIGGVHRGAEESMDISADLQELAQTSVAVVSAGAKAILDIPRTLEYLETMGVPVLGYQSEHFGAFYYRSSGIPLELVCNTPHEVADFLQMKWNMGLKGGVLISNPIQKAFEIPAERIEPAIAQALEDAKSNGISGKKITPFLLAQIKAITEGKSLEANIELVKNNVKVGAEIALALASKKRMS